MIGVVGSLTYDQVDGGPPRIGGGPYHCGRGLRAAGAEAVLVAKADDESLVDALRELGLPIAWSRSGSAVSFRIDYGAGARRMVIDGLGDPWTPEDARGWVADALADAGWVHVAPLSRGDFPPDTLAELAHRRRLSLDGQGLVRPARTGPLELDADYDPELLRHVSILKLAEEEAELLVDLDDRQSLARLGVPEVIVTLGERGSLVLADGAVQHITANAVDSDPTGAGDAFAAVYLAARSRNLVPGQAAREATAAVARLLAA